MAWLFLVLAIGAEITGTVSLRAVAGADGRSPLVLLTVVSYVISFAALGATLRTLGVGVVYAIWSAVGTVAVALLGWYLFGDRIAVPGLVGIVLVILGVVLLVASGSASHSR
jgi:small multidrug resistance pump